MCTATYYVPLISHVRKATARRNHLSGEVQPEGAREALPAQGCDRNGTGVGYGCYPAQLHRAPTQGGPEPPGLPDELVQCLREHGVEVPDPEAGGEPLVIRSEVGTADGGLQECRRYKPYTVNGTPMPVCGVVTFVYTIR